MLLSVWIPPTVISSFAASNPALYTRCTLLWMGAWSPYSMRAPKATSRSCEFAAGEFDEAEEMGQQSSVRGNSNRSGGEGKRAKENVTEGKEDLDKISCDSWKWGGKSGQKLMKRVTGPFAFIYESIPNAALSMAIFEVLEKSA